MKRFVAVVVVVAGVVLLFGGRPADPGTSDPVRVAALVRQAAVHAATADDALERAEQLMNQGTREAGRGQADVLGGDDDPVLATDRAAEFFEAAAAPVDEAQDALSDLAWTMRVISPKNPPPTLDLRGADVLNIGAQWRATGLPLSGYADLRRAAEATLESLGDALAALDADDPQAALAAVAEAEASLDVVSAFNADLTTLPFWIATVDAILVATGDIARAAEAGDEAALAAAQAAWDAAAADAARADQALTIALGEATIRVTGPASASSSAARRAVAGTRDALAGLSILP